jgi:hypothetical protein
LFIGKGENMAEIFLKLLIFILNLFCKKMVWKQKTPKLCVKLFYKKMTEKCETISKKRFQKNVDTKYFCTPSHTRLLQTEAAVLLDTQKSCIHVVLHISMCQKAFVYKKPEWKRFCLQQSLCLKSLFVQKG